MYPYILALRECDTANSTSTCVITLADSFLIDLQSIDDRSWRTCADLSMIRDSMRGRSAVSLCLHIITLDLSVKAERRFLRSRMMVWESVKHESIEENLIDGSLTCILLLKQRNPWMEWMIRIQELAIEVMCFLLAASDCAWSLICRWNSRERWTQSRRKNSCSSIYRFFSTTSRSREFNA